MQTTEILDEVLELYGPKLKNKSVSVARRYRSKDDIHAVEGEIRQIFANLVANSIDAMPQGGTLYLERLGPSRWVDARWLR